MILFIEFEVKFDYLSDSVMNIIHLKHKIK